MRNLGARPGDRLLLVGGNRDEVEVYECGLAMYGFQVETLPDVAGLLEAIETFQPAAIVLDLEFCDPAVWEVVGALQKREDPDLPVILLTAWIRADGAIRARASPMGCAAFVVKPCTPDQLAGIARAVIGGVRGLSISRTEQFAAIHASIPGSPSGSSPLDEEALVRLMRAEFREMPGLRLTIEQASRLWGAAPATCAAALTRLVDTQVLRRTRDGAYVRIA